MGPTSPSLLSTDLRKVLTQAVALVAIVPLFDLDPVTTGSRFGSFLVGRQFQFSGTSPQGARAGGRSPRRAEGCAARPRTAKPAVSL